MQIERLCLVMLVLPCLTTVFGCRESKVDSGSPLNPAAEQTLQEPSGKSNHALGKDGTSNMPNEARPDKGDSQLRVEVGEKGVDVEVGGSVDVNVGKGGVDVDISPKPQLDDRNEGQGAAD